MYLLADSMNCLMVYAWYSLTAVLGFWTDSVIKSLLGVMNYRQ